MASVSHTAAEQARERESNRPRKKHNPILAKPLTEEQAKRNTGIRYDICARTQALTLLGIGWPTRAVEEAIGIPQRTLRNILEKAKKRGYNPDNRDKRVLLHYVEDADIPGRPREIKDEQRDALIKSVQSDRNNREKSSEVIAYEHGISSSSTLNILHENGFNSVKKTTKPGLNIDQRAARLQWCIAHKDWTLENWKNVIWTDETSVCLGQKRGYTRVWRKGDEVFDKTVIRQRWSGYSEFMFWGCFTYDEIGPCHIFITETAKIKKDALKHIKLLDAELEQEVKTEWELDLIAQGPQPGRRQPKWSWTDKKGRLKRGGKGGVDWYKYWTVSSQLSCFCLTAN
jgi:transposase